jgi:4-hydroxy-tetrahydrodipicolinate reductase
MKKINVAVIGAGGRMGQEIANALSVSKKAKAYLGVSRLGKPAGYENTANGLKATDFKNVHVVVDFSSKENFAKVLDFCTENKIPLVSGTTGVDSKDLRRLAAAGKKIPVLWSPNMSIGVAVLAKALAALEKISEFDFQLEELHHSQKKDKPSGTALFLQDTLQKAVGKKCPEPVSIRGGGIFGIHKIYAMSDDEVLLFEHTALNRKVFAKGAITTSEWLLRQKPGLYSMGDVVK